jgi:phosphoglycolate phosphatase-like HAD superfamily hydrolase
MSLRIGFDMDGVLADLASAYREVEARLFGPEEVEEEAPESVGDTVRLKPDPTEDAAQVRLRRDSTGATDAVRLKPDATQDAAQVRLKPDTTGATDTVRLKPDPTGVRALERKRELVWRAIETTENFWTTLRPLDESAPARIQALAARHRWEIFFITQRPDTAGDTVQRQTQRWLAARGFDLPSVIVAHDSRGKVAAALQLDYLVDDTAKNCVDVIAESKTRPILIARNATRPVQVNARALGIGIAASIGDALDLLERAQAAKDDPPQWKDLARAVGWK